MLRTPSDFTPLLVAQAHFAPIDLLFSGDRLMVRELDLALPDFSATASLHIDPERFQPVGLLRGVYCRTAWVSEDSAPAEGYVFRKLRSLFGAIDDGLLAVAGRAYQIVEWSRTHRFCGACGGPTAPVAGERCVRCAACGHVAYPRISPAMMVLVKRGDSVLLAQHLNSRFFTALAGFLEAGESIEDAIHREVLEEVGVKVRNLQYFGNQSWPFPHSLMLAFTAEYDGGDIVPQRDEIAQAGWFGPHDPPPPVPPLGLSIAGHLIRANLRLP
ncbi:MAG: NAD(+) diphosphatase [Burkholderiaceae bacterium]